jgi:hypothetical protein
LIESHFSEENSTISFSTLSARRIQFMLLRGIQFMLLKMHWSVQFSTCGFSYEYRFCDRLILKAFSLCNFAIHQCTCSPFQWKYQWTWWNFNIIFLSILLVVILITWHNLFFKSLIESYLMLVAHTNYWLWIFFNVLKRINNILVISKVHQFKNKGVAV